MRPRRPSRTAEVVCFFRAVEHTRPAHARILDDPWAARFLGGSDRALLATGFGPAVLPALATYVVARHRHVDEALLAALDAGVEQVVILGAGYDARAWRFAEALRGRPVFEVDHPATQARKARLAAALDTPDADLRRVPVDFRVDRLADALLDAGFRPGRPAFFAWEGVTMYLRRADVHDTLTTMRALGGPGSRLAFDAWSDRGPGPVAAARRAAARLVALVGEPLTFALPPADAPALLADTGWHLRDLADAASLRARHVRDGRRVYPDTYVVVAERP